MHGDMTQRERTRTLTGLRQGHLKILVATDVAARGINVTDITHVINFDLPKFAEDYVHRIGRTGRAGASGIAVSFASDKDTVNLKKIERFTGNVIASHVIPGMEPRFKPRTARTDGNSRKIPSNGDHKGRRVWSNSSDTRNGNATSYDRNKPTGYSSGQPSTRDSQRRTFRSDSLVSASHQSRTK